MSSTNAASTMSPMDPMLMATLLKNDPLQKRLLYQDNVLFSDDVTLLIRRRKDVDNVDNAMNHNMTDQHHHPHQQQQCPVYVMDNLPGAHMRITPEMLEAKLLYLDTMIVQPNMTKDPRKRTTAVDENRNLLLHKCSVQDRSSITLKEWEYHQLTLLSLIQLYKSPTRHNHHNDAWCCSWKSWMSFGYRQSVRDRRVQHYVGLRSGIADSDMEDLAPRLSKLAHDLESLASRRFPPEHLDAMHQLRTEFDLDDAVLVPNGLATHMSIAQGYWTSVQVAKKKCSFLIISCLSTNDFRNRKSQDQVLFFVVLPSCNVAIPMTSGDVLILDPTVPHCITDPRDEDCFIIMLHTSPKTYVAKLTEDVAKTLSL